MSIKETKLAEYAELTKKIAELEEMRSSLKESIAQEFKKNEIQTYTTDYGSFYFTTRKTWYYSDVVTQMEDELKMRKEQEQKKQVAECVESSSLAFRAKE